MSKNKLMAVIEYLKKQKNHKKFNKGKNDNKLEVAEWELHIRWIEQI